MFKADGFSASHHGFYAFDQYKLLAAAIITALYAR